MTRVTIDRRFRGPPKSGNGGYVAGIVAKSLGGSDCAVMLHRPPPLCRALELEVGEEEARLLDGAELIASATRERVHIKPPAAPTLEAAEAAEQRFTGFHDHVFPGCFVCGPARVPGDGLRIFPGAIESGSEREVAASWTPDTSLLDARGNLRTEFVWAALDCPGYFAVQHRSGPAVLGRFAVVILEEEIAPQPLIVTGWPVTSSGRKHCAGSALYDPQRRLLAAGLATWISLES